MEGPDRRNMHRPLFHLSLREYTYLSIELISITVLALRALCNGYPLADPGVVMSKYLLHTGVIPGDTRQQGVA